MKENVFLLCSSFLTTQAIAQGTCAATLPNEFKMELIRVGTDEVIDNGVKVTRVYGDVGVNNQNFGRFFENPDIMIPEGTYQGTPDIIQTTTSLYQAAKDANGKSRSNILFHPVPAKSLRGMRDVRSTRARRPG
jgi:hypothetical protein